MSWCSLGDVDRSSYWSQDNRGILFLGGMGGTPMARGRSWTRDRTHAVLNPLSHQETLDTGNSNLQERDLVLARG